MLVNVFGDAFHCILALFGRLTRELIGLAPHYRTCQHGNNSTRSLYGRLHAFSYEDELFSNTGMGGYATRGVFGARVRYMVIIELFFV